ncbi:MAG: type II toxin-antitoxin system prevent-host-death family antitoxin [Thiohalocapsa sp.]|jgi:prevent-host-death family protein|uniref:type II toxin-antitoxin system Phd/YefM family antitoxin n=1 Tax=Thiohalocapsa sp. TaxID=2497641 RepID=UPI0025CEA9FB|nr:type II toxin-antitoxin system prevent-host-death family antitoxin [Thiohalocapsa sp.]
MQIVTTDYAAEHLDELIERVVQGESITLSSEGRPVVRLVRIEDDTEQEVPAAEVEEAFYGD